MDYYQDLAAYIKAHETYPGSIMPGTTFGGEVGTFYSDFVIWDHGRTQSRALTGLVDTGASYTLIPASILEELGIERRQTRAFTLADGSKRDFSIGWVEMELAGEIGPVHILFGPDNGNILLGTMTLEAFGLAADAKHHRLIIAELTL